MLAPVALPPIIFIFNHLLQVAPSYAGSVLPEHHRENAVLADSVFENDVDRCAVILGVCQDLAAFSRKHVGMQRYDASTSDKWKPRQPCSAHGVAQV